MPKEPIGEADPRPESESCSGRYIYVHRLPSKFNSDLLQSCSSLNMWFDMCAPITNMGLGPPLDLDKEIHFDNYIREKIWFNTNQFTLGVIFHNRMKRYECLTDDSSKASAVYVPFYAGLDAGRYLFGGFNTSVRDSLSLQLVDWLTSKPEWDRMSGRDHFFVAGRVAYDFTRPGDNNSYWGNKLLNIPHVRNMTMLTIESALYTGGADTAIPYPTYFHPFTDGDLLAWQNKTKKHTRPYLFSFVGAPRPNMDNSIRGQIINQCLNSNSTCRLLDCNTKITNKNGNISVCESPDRVINTFLSSTFCLQPPGDSFTRRSTFDSILAGCIPVFFNESSAYTQYVWHLPNNHSDYSVFIPENEIKLGKANIEEILRRIPEKQVAEMRGEVVRLIPKITYANPMSTTTSDRTFQDAFDIAVKGVLDKVEGIRRKTFIKITSKASKVEP
ncbi:hypothetical protein NMG60_11026603 [Bertholletia excelsa]